MLFQDGTYVPVTLFHTLPVEELREVPLLVHVYGAYGQDLNMEFHPAMRLLLEQGWALAYCHIRYNFTLTMWSKKRCVFLCVYLLGVEENGVFLGKDKLVWTGRRRVWRTSENVSVIFSPQASPPHHSLHLRLLVLELCQWEHYATHTHT